VVIENILCKINHTHQGVEKINTKLYDHGS